MGNLQKRAVVFDSWSAGWWDNHGAYTQKPCATPAPLPMVLNEEYRSTVGEGEGSLS
jgi:hypothetical protein